MSWRRGSGSVVVSEPGAHAPPQPLPPQPPPPLGELPLWRKLVVAAILVGLVASIVWQVLDRASDDVVAPPLTTAPGATVSTVTVPPSPPELRNTGEDFEAIARSVHELEDWVDQNDPDPKYISLTTHPECTCAKDEETWLRYLKDNGYRLGSPGSRLHKAILRHRSDENLATIYEIVEGLPAPIIDREGNVVAHAQILAPTGLLTQWSRGGDGRWRVYQIDALGPPGEGWENW